MSGTRLIPKPISGSGGTADLSTISGDATSTAGGVLSLANFHRKRSLESISGNTNKVYTAANLIGGWISRSVVTTTQADLTDTAANIVAAIPNVTIGSWFMFTILGEYVPTVKTTFGGGVGIGLSGDPVDIYGQTLATFIVIITSITSGLEAAYMLPISQAPLITTTLGNSSTKDVGTAAGTIAAGDHAHAGTYQPADGDLTTYAGLPPSANAQTLLGQTFAQMQGSLSVDDLITLSGVAEGSVNLSTFTGVTIADNVTIKAALQALETSLELKQTADATLTALAGLTIQDVSIIEGTNADAFNVVVSGGGNRLLGANSGNTALEFKDSIAVTSITDTVKIVDADAVTKAIQFDCGNVTAGQTRLVTFPDAAIAFQSKGYASISAGSIIPDTCAAIATNDSDPNKFDYLAFDGSTDEYAQFQWAPPDDWDLGTIKAKFVWAASAAMTNGHTVIWGLNGYAVSDGDTTDVAFDTGAVTVSDAYATSDETGPIQKISAATAAITIQGTPALGDIIHFRVHRDADTDTSTIDAWLIGIRIEYGKLSTVAAAW